MVTALLLALSAQHLTKVADLVGEWEGESICVNRKVAPNCHDEHVQYIVSKSKSGDAHLIANKRVDGKWEWMGNLEFHYDKDHHQWRADFKNSRVSVRWEFDAEKDRMTGVLRQFPEDVVVRKIQVRRISAR